MRNRRLAVGSVQNELNGLYFKYWDNISSLIGAANGLSHPLLISIPEAYLSQKEKLLIVGQQTNGWCVGSIDDLLECYKEFNFGKQYFSSPFWNVTRNLEKFLKIDPFAITWSNLNKCDFNGSRPNKKLEQEIYSKFPVLTGEIGLLKPDIVLFFSGPNYDSHLKRIFPKCKFINVSGFLERQLCRVEHQVLPFNSYRTYHPKYLRISGLELKVLNKLKAIIT